MYTVWHTKGDFADMVEVKILSWRGYPGLLPCGHSVITKLFIRERGREEGQRRHDDGNRG